MSKNVFLYDRSLQQLQLHSGDNVVYIPEEDVMNVTREHKEDLDNNFGRLTLDENDKLIYEDYMTTIIVDKERFFFSEGVYGRHNTDPRYYEVSVKKSEFVKYDYIRQDSQNGTRQVLYYDNDFHVLTINRGQKFDYKMKKVVKDISYDLDQILFRFTKDNLEYDVKYNGFPFEVNGKKYLQPFRGMEDRTYLSALKNDVSPENREIKFFKDNGDGKRNSQDFDMLRGEVISDIFLEGMILKIIQHENVVRPIVQQYWQEMLEARKNEDLETLTKLADGFQQNIIKRIEDEITNAQ